MHYHLGSADQQSHWLGLLLGHYRYALSLPRPVCYCCKPLPSSWSQSDSQWLNSANSAAIPWGEIRLGRSGYPSGLSSHWRHWSSEETSPPGSVLALGGSNAVVMSCFSYPSNEGSLGLLGAGRYLEAKRLLPCSSILSVESCS